MSEVGRANTTGSTAMNPVCDSNTGTASCCGSDNNNNNNNNNNISILIIIVNIIIICLFDFVPSVVKIPRVESIELKSNLEWLTFGVIPIDEGASETILIETLN